MSKVVSNLELSFRRWCKAIRNGKYKYEPLPDEIFLYPVSVDDPNCQSCPPVVTMDVTFNFDFLTENGKPNDNAPDSVRPDLHTDGKG